MTRKHKLKINAEYFQDICEGNKSFEIRKDDRDYQVGDILLLQEYLPEREEYTGRVIQRKVTYVTDYEQKENYVVMAIIRESVQELEHDKEHLELIKERQEEEYRKLYEENQRYKQALEFYANKQNYREMVDQSGVETIIEEDNGRIARQALKGESE